MRSQLYWSWCIERSAHQRARGLGGYAVGDCKCESDSCWNAGTCTSQRQLAGVNKTRMCCGQCYWDNPNCPLGEKNWLFTARSLLQGCRCARERIPGEEIPFSAWERYHSIYRWCSWNGQWWWAAYSSSSGQRCCESSSQLWRTSKLCKLQLQNYQNWLTVENVLRKWKYRPATRTASPGWCYRVR